MNRRDVLIAAGASATTLAAAGHAAANSKHGSKHSGHYQPAYEEFRKQAEECLGDGHACLDHCLVLLENGDRSIADCAKLVKQMIAICAAVGPVASTGSRHAKSLAKLCHDVCVDCKKECDKHAAKHPICKTCGESCAKMIELTKAI